MGETGDQQGKESQRQKTSNRIESDDETHVDKVLLFKLDYAGIKIGS
jgi:hypothetical protein